MELMLQPLRKYADFQGRARRKEYWLFALFYLVVGIIAGAIDASLWRGTVILQALVGLGVLVPSLAVGFRRLHDIDKSAWWMLIAFVPVVGAIVLLVFYVLPGTVGPNRFGADPKGAEATPDPIVA